MSIKLNLFSELRQIHIKRARETEKESEFAGVLKMCKTNEINRSSNCSILQNTAEKLPKNHRKSHATERKIETKDKRKYCNKYYRYISHRMEVQK